jgi:hypothetical protein
MPEFPSEQPPSQPKEYKSDNKKAKNSAERDDTDADALPDFPCHDSEFFGDREYTGND